MKKNKIIITVIAGVVVLIALIIGIMSITIHNSETRLRTAISAQQTSNKANFDKMFKVIKQVAETAKAKMEVSKDAFKEIYPALIEGRYSKGDGSLMKLIVESNPTFDLTAAGSLYDKLATAIEANRNEFFVEQQKLIDKQREHKNLIMTWPGYWFLDAKDTISIIIVTSTTTKEVFSKGEENEIDLFKKDSTKK